MSKDVINVYLYGGKGLFGGREKPLEASIISCDKYDKCSYYQSGQCLAIRSFGSSGCKFGSTRTEKGYTSRAKKYRKFKDWWESHEQYAKLKHPPTKLGLIDGVVVFPYPHVCIKKEDNGLILLKDPYLGSGTAFIEYDQFTTDLIYRLCTFKPQAMMGGEIKDYQKKTIPLFLAHFKEVLPERYQEFVSTHEEFNNEVDHTGRKAYLKTINPSPVYYKSKSYPQFDEEWYWDGEYLRYKSGHVKSFNITKNYEVEEIKIKPSNESEIKITDNNQVSIYTKFID
ncbi:hypothetical protein [Halobacillus litoralis]|uniref:hypothetical protein n=1 Tax=Halobacillus litoralis TaxID=45668 RepID=UPI001CD5CAE0|nr:hypothetical protein [Halobacillus litoralis]MCA1021548.1 hypothetical protein [Halobacillus litoralis]